MTARVAIIADDLTGALDTSTPFVDAGLSVVVATGLDGVGEALAKGAEVVAVNTASRGLPPEMAAARVSAAIAAFGPERPQVIFKKIDSRLKGNVAAEAIALAVGAGRAGLVVAPAVPDQQRFTVDEAVVGRGVETPLPIRPLFAESPLPVQIVEAQSDSDLDALVDRQDWGGVVAVGARGLGAALARHLGERGRDGEPFYGEARTLFAFGSRDPMTEAQIERLCERDWTIAVLDALEGQLEFTPGHSLPLVLRCTGALTAEPEAVAARFAGGVKTALRALRPSTLVMGGGDTALAILDALGVKVLTPMGEAAPGLAWFLIETGEGHGIRCVVKSGGFGDMDVLAALVANSGRDRVLVS